MERPKLTKEMIAATAAAFCERNGWGTDEAADLARVCSSAHMDGYELAKELDSMCGWMPTAQDVETLDNFGCDLREALRQACIAWAEHLAAGACEQLLAVERGLQVVHDLDRQPGRLDGLQHVPRRGAAGVVQDGELGHDRDPTRRRSPVRRSRARSVRGSMPTS